MVDGPIVYSELAGDEGTARRQAGRIRDIDILEAKSFARHEIDRRACVAVIAVAAEVISPLRVDVDVENAGHGSRLVNSPSLYPTA